MCTPPPVKYFAHDPFISVRLTNEYPFYPGQNFGDTISNKNIFESYSSVNKTDIFNQPIVILYAVDLNAAETVKEAYVKSGIPSYSIFIRGIDSDIVRVWDQSESRSWEESRPDILGIISRVTVPEDASETAYQLYKKRAWPARYYMAFDSQKAGEPAHPPVKPRYDETVPDEVTNVKQSLDQLALAMKSFFSDEQRGSNFTGTQHVNLTSEGCYDDWLYVLSKENNDSYVAGTRDATYGIPVVHGPGDGQVLNNTAAVLIGIIHSKYMKTAYSSAGVDLRSGAKYLETHWFLEDLEGSAARYLPSDPLVEYLFAIDIYYTGGCASGKGIASNPQWCIEYNQSSVIAHPATYLMIGERVYSVEKTYLVSAANTTIGCELLNFRISL